MSLNEVVFQCFTLILYNFYLLLRYFLYVCVCICMDGHIIHYSACIDSIILICNIYFVMSYILFVSLNSYISFI